jgi:hypothetical protein
VEVHGEDLIAFHVAMRGLEDQLGAVGGEIGFGVLSSESELMHIPQMLLLRRGEIGRSCGLRRKRGQQGECNYENGKDSIHGMLDSVAKAKQPQTQRTQGTQGKTKSPNWSVFLFMVLICLVALPCPLWLSPSWG